MMTPHIKGAASCIFTHIHLHTGVYTPIHDKLSVNYQYFKNINLLSNFDIMC